MDHAALVRDYYDGYRRKDRRRLEELLHPDVRFVSPWARYDHRDTMLDDIWPAVGQVWAVDLRIFGSGPELVVCYVHSDRPDAHLAERIRFVDGRIAEIEVYLGVGATGGS